MKAAYKDVTSCNTPRLADQQLLLFGLMHRDGPWGFKRVTNVEDMLHFAEFGVVLGMLLQASNGHPAQSNIR